MRIATRFAGLAAGIAMLAGSAASAQDYPARPITLIVPFAAGGPTDVIARIVGDHMSKTLGQQLVIENIVGAGGTTASTRAMRATNDGYTIIMGHMGTHAASVALYPNLAYHPLKNFETIGLAAGTPVLDSRQEGFPGEGSQGIRRLREGEYRQDEHGACRRRLGVVHDLPAAQLDHGREADHDPLSGHGPGDERADRRPGRLHVRPDRQRGAADQRRHDQVVRDRNRRAQSRRCRMCRPQRKPACRNSRPRPGTACSRPRARRSR